MKPEKLIKTRKEWIYNIQHRIRCYGDDRDLIDPEYEYSEDQYEHFKKYGIDRYTLDHLEQWNEEIIKKFNEALDAYLSIPKDKVTFVVKEGNAEAREITYYRKDREEPLDEERILAKLKKEIKAINEGVRTVIINKTYSTPKIDEMPPDDGTVQKKEASGSDKAVKVSEYFSIVRVPDEEDMPK